MIYLGTGLAMKWPVFEQQLPLLIFATALAALIVWKHRTNIQRLLAGTEQTFKMEEQSGQCPNDETGNPNP